MNGGHEKEKNMDINIVQLVVIVILAGLVWYANNTLNQVPVLKNVLNVIIVVVSVLLILQSTGLISSSSTHISVK